MATTTRRKRAKEIVEKMIVEELIPLKEEAKSHFLPDHFRQLEVLVRNIEIAKKDMALEEQRLANMKLELKLLEHDIEKKILIVKQKATEYQASLERFGNFRKEVYPEYGISENESIGYDTNTGEIKR
jgi:hypothetical protein